MKKYSHEYKGYLDLALEAIFRNTKDVGFWNENENINDGINFRR